MMLRPKFFQLAGVIIMKTIKISLSLLKSKKDSIQAIDFEF